MCIRALNKPHFQYYSNKWLVTYTQTNHTAVYSFFYKNHKKIVNHVSSQVLVLCICFFSSKKVTILQILCHNSMSYWLYIT